MTLLSPQRDEVVYWLKVLSDEKKDYKYLQNSACMPGWREPEAEACPVEKGRDHGKDGFWK